MSKPITVTLAAAALLGAAALPVAAFAEAGDFQIRVRALAVVPDADADVVPLGGSAEIENDYVPEIDFTYFVTDHIGLELIAAVTKHDVQATAGPTDLGYVRLLPPTLTLQYHFSPDATFRPYVGAGVNYTIFWDENGAPGLPMEYEDSFGAALQAGMDYALDEHWFLNIDVKKIFLSTEVSVAGGAVTADVDIDPWIVGAGFGYRF